MFYILVNSLSDIVKRMTNNRRQITLKLVSILIQGKRMHGFNDTLTELKAVNNEVQLKS